jgi:hypothetical protein
MVASYNITNGTSGAVQLTDADGNPLSIAVGATITNVSLTDDQYTTAVAIFGASNVIVYVAPVVIPPTPPWTVVYPDTAPAGEAVVGVSDTGTLLFGAFVTTIPTAPPVTSPSATQTVVASSTPPASLSVYSMQGLAAHITPAVTGTVLVTVCGTVYEATGTAAGDGISFTINYGTGSAPSNGDAVGGTAAASGNIQTFNNNSTSTTPVKVPFSMTVLVTGLKVGTTYWFDVAALALGHASSFGLSGIVTTLVET